MITQMYEVIIPYRDITPHTCNVASNLRNIEKTNNIRNNFNLNIL